MPEKEKLSLLARSQSTMCIFLSAGVVDQVQRELLEHYPPTTPVAACYHLTWKDERIFRGQLQDLAKIVNENHLTLTTMIVVAMPSIIGKDCHDYILTNLNTYSVNNHDTYIWRNH